MKTSIKKKRIYLITSIPLIAGFIIYFSCRPRTLAYYLFIPFKNKVDLNSFHFALYEKCINYFDNSFFGNLFIYSIPGALYSFSLSFYLKKRYLQKRIYKESLKKRIFKYILLSLIISLPPELLQYIGLLPGNYDTTDVITAFLAACFGSML